MKEKHLNCNKHLISHLKVTNARGTVRANSLIEEIKKILNIKYTPDFVGKHFIIETKGRANESFPMRWKLFKKYIAENKLEPFTLYKPQNQKECDETIQLILEKQKQSPGKSTQSER